MYVCMYKCVCVYIYIYIYIYSLYGRNFLSVLKTVEIVRIFLGFWWIESSKGQHLLEINAFTDTFDQFNA